MKKTNKEIKREQKNRRRLNELNRQNSKVSTSETTGSSNEWFESVKTKSDSNYVEIRGKVNFPKINDTSNILSSPRYRLKNYETRLIGGIKSLRDDSHVRSGGFDVTKIETHLKLNPKTTIQSEGNDTGTIFLFHWSPKHECFLSWRLLRKDSVYSKVGMFLKGNDMTSIVNREFVEKS